MYESFYGLRSKPFSMLPDPCFLYLSKKHLTALTLLEYGLMNHVGFCVISGETGAGKTTLLRKLLDNVEETVTVGMITNTHQSFGELLDWVLSAFGIHKSGLNKVEMHQKFIDFLLQQYARGKTCLLIVDEAQNMSPATLEELRMLSNVNSESDQLLQVILSGQPALKETLRHPSLRQFAQRIGVDYHLDALSEQETCNYIQHRLVTAGAERDIFTPAACSLIYRYSGGTPRLINLLCDTALVYGFADHDETITEAIVEEMVQERMKDSVVPLFNKEGDNRATQDSGVVEFPWIMPQGGTSGLKPYGGGAPETPPDDSAAAETPEKKTPVKAESSPPSDAAGTPPAAHESQHPADPPDADPQGGHDSAPVPDDAAGDSGAAVDDRLHVESPDRAETKNTGNSSPEAAAAERAAARKGHTEERAEPVSAADYPRELVRVAEPTAEKKLPMAAWVAMAAAGVIAIVVLFYSFGADEAGRLAAGSSGGRAGAEPADLPKDVRRQLEELQRVKDEIVRMRERQLEEQKAQERAEALRRERDAALEQARQEEAKRAEQAAAAKAAVQREQAALAAAAAAAEKALKAAEEASRLAEKQRREEERLNAEKERLEEERKQAELNKLRLEAEKKQAELEQRRLQEARTAEIRAREEWEQRQQQEAKKLQETAAKAAAAKAAEEEAEPKESRFVTDPCSSPSAKFLSTCR